MDFTDKVLSTLSFLNLWFVYSYGRDIKSLCFPVIGDIGGLPSPPFTTWNQRKLAEVMGKVCEFHIIKAARSVAHISKQHLYIFGISQEMYPKVDCIDLQKYYFSSQAELWC